MYFGTFNPIHKGHLALGIYFAEQTDLDQVWYVVSPQNPFKVDDLLLDDQHRLKMVRLALEDEPKLTASDIEFFGAGLGIFDVAKAAQRLVVNHGERKRQLCDVRGWIAAFDNNLAHATACENKRAHARTQCFSD